MSQFHLLTPDPDAGLSPGAGFNYLRQTVRACTVFQSRLDRPEPTLIMVSAALLPGGGRLIEIQASSEFPGRADLQRLLEDVRIPRVFDAPFAFFLGFVLGEWKSEFLMQPPFATLGLGNPGDDVPEFLRRVARNRGWGPRPSGFWERVAGFFRRLTGRSSATPATVGEEFAIPADAQDLEKPDLGPRPEDLEEQLRKSPHDVALLCQRVRAAAEDGDPALAAEFCQTLLQLRPGWVWPRVALVDARIQSGETAEALRLVKHLVEECPGLAAAHDLLGTLYVHLGAEDRSLECWRTACRLDPRRAELRRKLATAAGRAGLREEALQALNAAEVLDPNEEQLYALRARVWQLPDASGGIPDDTAERVLADLDRAIALDDAPVDALLQRAEWHLRDDAQSTVADCRRVLELDPENGAAHAFLGMAQLQREEFDEAIAACSKAIELDSPVRVARLARGDAYYFQELWDEAFDDYAEFLSENPTHAWGNLRMGEILLRREDYPAAEAAFDVAIAQMPGLASGYIGRGNARRGQKLSELAFADFSEALQRDADSAFAYFGRAQIHFAERRFDDSLADFDAGLAIEPEVPDALYHRALVRIELKQWDAALEDLNRTLQIDPESAMALFARAGLSQRRGEPEAAIRDYQEIRRNHPALAAFACDCEAQVWLQCGKTEEAQQAFQQAIELDPGNAEQYRIHGLLTEVTLKHQQGDYAAAIETASQALELDEQCASAWHLRAGAYWYSAQFVEAIDDYTQCLEICGPNFSVLMARGQVYAELGEYERSLEDLNEALDLAENVSDESVAYLHSGRALAYSGLSRFAEAEADFDRSILQCPGNAWVHYNHGLMHHARQERSHAATCFRLALAVSDPPLPPFKAARARAFLGESEQELV